LWEIN